MIMFAAGLAVGLLLSNTTVTPEDVQRAKTLTVSGWKLWTAQKWDEAQAKFEEAVKLDPEQTNAWNGLGWSCFNGGDDEKAEEAFKKCVELEPDHPAALNGLGQIHFFRRNYAEAEKKWLLISDERLPGDEPPAHWYGLAKMYLLQGKYDESAKWTKKILAKQPNDDGLKRMLTACEAKKLDDDLRRQIEPPEASSSMASRKGWALAQKGKFTEAAKEFRKAIQRDPKEANAYNGLGFCLLSSGNAPKAKPNFEKCLQLQPEHWGAVNGLAKCLKIEGKTSEAIALWEKMVEKCPGLNAGHYGLAGTYMEQGHYEKAIKINEEILKANPNDEQARQAIDQARKALAEKK